MTDPTSLDLLQRLEPVVSTLAEEYVGYSELAHELRSYLAAHSDPAAGPTDEDVLALRRALREQGKRADLPGVIRAALARWGHQPPHPEHAALAEQALEVLEALAKNAAKDEQLTIAKDWGFGGATLITSDGSHTHVGGDWGETHEENLKLFVQGLHQLLVEGSGLSWVPREESTKIDGLTDTQLRLWPHR